MTADVFTTDGYFAVIPEVVLDADISAQAVRLYAVLRRYADQRTGHAHPGRKTLAARMRVSNVKTVDRALAELEHLGVVETFARFAGPDGTISRVKDAAHPEQTSNGYVVGGDIRGQGGPTKGTTPHPSGGEGVAPPEGHEPKPLEPEPSEPHIGVTSSIDDEFELWYAEYPRKVGKKPALARYKTARRKQTAEQLLAALQAFRFSPDPQFVAHPATWLHQERWSDVQSSQATDTRSRSQRVRDQGGVTWQLPEQAWVDEARAEGNHVQADRWQQQIDEGRALLEEARQRKYVA